VNSRIIPAAAITLATFAVLGAVEPGKPSLSALEVTAYRASARNIPIRLFATATRWRSGFSDRMSAPS
jgi:hypothetical protein